MRPKTPSKKRLALLLVALLAIGMLPLPAVAAGTTLVMDAHLPTARDGTAAIATDDAIYIFGGDSGGTRHDEILHYDPVTDVLTPMGATLPSPRSGMSAVWTGTYVYLFGGWGSPYSDQVIRYDPANDTVTVMGATLPSARIYTSAVWDGQFAYVFGGGISSATTTDEILRYDPATDSVTTLSATLPTPRYGTSAVWDGQYAYVIGGVTLSTGLKHDQIVRFDPATADVAVLGVSLPTPRYHTSAVYAGGAAHVFGGYDCGSGVACDTILDIDLEEGTLAVNSTVLTTERYLTSAAYFGRYAYIIGGIDGTRKDEILRHGPIEPNRPPQVDTLADLTLQATTSLVLNISATDPDADPLTLVISTLPGGADFTDHGDGTATLEWVPTRAQEGSHSFLVTVDDGELTDTEGFTIEVTRGPDRPPVFDPIADQNATAESPLTVGVSATDPDGDPIALSATGPTGIAFTDHGDGTATFQWTPTRAQAGEHTITVEALAYGNTTTTSFDVNVTLPPNQAPVIDPIPDQEAYFKDVLQVPITATDAEGDPIALDLAPLPGNATFVDDGDGTAHFQWGIEAVDQGSHVFTVTAHDGNDTSNETFTVTVWSGPPPNIVPVDDRTVSEGESFGISIAGDDPNGRNLTFSILPALPLGAYFLDNGNGTAAFGWDVPFDAQGDHTFTVTADNGERTASESFTITVLDVDQGPIIDTLVANVTIPLGDDLALDYTAHDPDGTAITWSANGLPAGATFSDGGAGTATLAWDDAQPVGTYSVTLRAASNGKWNETVQNVRVVRPYEFATAHVGAAILIASPDEVVPLTFRIKNTGFLENNYTFDAFDTAGTPEGFLFGPLPPLTLQPGEERILSVNVTVPPAESDASTARPRVVVTPENGDGRFLNWIIQVPVLIDILPVHDNPSVAELEALIFFHGHVNLTWANGLPAPNLTMRIHHRMQDLVTTDPLTGGTRDVQADANGTWMFDAKNTDQPGEMTYGLPGVHHLTVSVTRSQRTDTEVGTWRVLTP